MTRLLGIDLGDRRIGLAIADASVDGTRSRPFTTLRRGRTIDEDVAALRGVVEEQRIGELVVGLPLEARSGDEGEQAAATRAWAETAAEALGLPLTFRDERLSSQRAEARVGPMRRGRAGGPPTPAQRDAYRARLDREAAAIILDDELDARSSATAIATTYRRESHE